MNGKNICNKCNKEFSTKGNLTVHQKTICSEEPNMLVCLYCKVDFCRKTALNNHIKICPKKDEYLIKQQFEEYKTRTELQYEKTYSELLKITELYEKLKIEYETRSERFAASTESFKEHINKLNRENEYLKGQLKVFKERERTQTPVQPAQNQVINYINNGIINNNMFIQNLEPITDELIRKTGESIGMLDLKDGVPGVMRKFQPILKNRVICTDATRNSLMYNYNGKLKRDSRGQMITDKILSSTEGQFNRFREEINKYYQSIDHDKISESEREKIDNSFENYKEYSRAIRTKNELSKKKISKRVAKIIVNFSKSKAQFEMQLHSGQSPECTVQSGATIQDSTEESQDPERQIVSYTDNKCTHTIAECPEEPTVNSETISKHGRLNRVAITRQTLVNGRIFEQHLDAQGGVVRQIRLRSSGLPYLTDEETDPSSREQSDHSSSDSDQEFTLHVPERKKITWPSVDM